MEATDRSLAPRDPASSSDDSLFRGLEPAPAARDRGPRWTPARLLMTLGRRVAYWAPVWLPLALLAQIVWLGLRPARVEARRLEQAEQVLDERLAEGEALRTEYALRLRAYRDPMYLERERKLLEARGQPAR